MNTERNLSRAQAQRWLTPVLIRTIRISLILVAVLLVVHVVLLLAVGAQCTRLVGLSGRGWVVPLDMLSCENPGAKPVYSGQVREANFASAEKNAGKVK